jgi:GDPmannose 4,6-dehydratase
MDPAVPVPGAAVRALITGVLGQDGSYLAEQLIAGGHTVYGLTRRPKATSPATLILGDLLDQESLEQSLMTAEPDVVFNLAAVTSPGVGWGTQVPPLMVETTGIGVVHLLDAMVKRAPAARLVHASSSAVLEPERYGLYGAAKVLAHQAVQGYRDHLGLTASNAILFSHTSPRQDARFLAPRICRSLARGERIMLTDLRPKRDWGWSPDYCEALQVVAQAEPGDYVVATGEQHSVAEFLGVALATTGRDMSSVDLIQFPGSYADERRPPAEMPDAQGLGWKPRTSFVDMVRQLVEAG